MSSRRLRCVLLCLALAACKAARTQMNDVMQLAAAVQSQFQTPVSLNVTGGSLTVSLASQATDKLSAADQNALALSVARFAYAHYGHPEALSRVTVTFVFRSSSGPINYSRRDPGGSWPTSQLVAQSSPDLPLSLTPVAFEDTLLVTTADSGRLDTVGTMVRSLRSMSPAQGHPGWGVVVTYRRPHIVPSVDSLRLDATTFFPVSERRHNAHGLTRLVYDGAHVHGVIDSGATVRAVDTTFEAAPFAAAQLELVIRALPLAPGFTATVPMYYPAYSGLVRTTVRVVGSDSAAWTVEASNGPGTAQRIRIARSSRLLIDIRDATDSAHATSYVRR
jgi:hypothetical protein